jgi:putative ABC transport system permease protein
VKEGHSVTIVGIDDDERRDQLIEPPERHYYLSPPPTRDYTSASILELTSPTRSQGVAAAATREAASIFPGREARIRRMADILAPQYRPWELGATLFSVVGLLALFVAGIGVFSTLSHDVSQRRHELGVRVALGASVADVVRLVLGDGLRVVLVGAAAGALLAVAAGRLIASLLYGVAPGDPAALTTVVLVLLAVAATASIIPALRASRTDPLEALRAE